MEDYELTLFDRLNVIKDTINKYGEDKFYIAFSGGKDSAVLHYLIDMAVPNNQIPRVYVDTGIGLNMIDEFVRKLSENDKRIITIKSNVPIKKALEQFGYPVKSKIHSFLLEKYQRIGMTKGVKNYLGVGDNPHLRMCPNVLRYQFTPEFKIPVSDKCCKILKEQPMENWQKENNKPITITGIMAEEGGRRWHAKCIVKNGKTLYFNPLAKANKEFEDWFIHEYNLKICDIYYPPYNAERTGCKGCPFALHLQNELDFLEKYFPNERKQCEIIWKPIYEEYRKHNYRLKGDKHE